MSNYDYDLLVIGAGSGGIATANRAGMRGAKVAIVEAKALGGTCVNVGCVPKKVTWSVANLVQSVSDFAKSYGLDYKLNSFDYKKMVDGRDAYIERIHKSYSNSFAANKVELIQGWASFVDSNTLNVKSADGTNKQYTAKQILITAGGKPSIPDVEGAEYGITSDGFFELTELPKSVTIVGAGYIAVEIAGVFAAFGVQVNLVTRGSRPLRFLDDDLAQYLLKSFQHQNINLVNNAQITKVTKDSNGLLHMELAKSEISDCVDCNQHNLTSECLIWAIGREPNLSGLALENTKVTLDDKGFIAVDQWCQTQDPSVLALGDNINAPQLTPVAIKTGRLLAERLYGGQPESRFKSRYIPTVIFSHPAIGYCGMTETAALKQFGAYSPENPQGIKVYRSKFTSVVSALNPEDERQMTFMKLVVKGENEEVIGLHGIGVGVDEMIQGFAVAIEMGATKADFDSTVAIHPTGAEEFVTMR